LPDATLERWTELLEELEHDAAHAGDDAELAAWRPPADLGPIPAELRARAEALLDAQAVAMATVVAAQRSTARHLAALRTVPQGRGETGPLYLDASG
jgi:hypothetical protein